MVVRRFVCAASFCLVFSTLIMLFKWNYPSCNMRAWVHCAMTDPYTFKRISPKLPLVIGHEYDHNIIYDHSQSIDAVILWVNGSDPILREQMEAYPPSSAMYDSAGLSSSRVRDLGFVKSLILSISKNAPWMRNIYVVSGTHRPSWWVEYVFSRSQHHFFTAFRIHTARSTSNLQQRGYSCSYGSYPRYC